MALVLIVDDDEKIRDTLYDLLSSLYHCRTAESSEKALALLAAESYDLVLTDLSMSGISGVELLSLILQKYPTTPVIIISGISDQEHARGLIKMGAFDFLLKPFRLDVIEESVKRALDYRGTLMGTSGSPDSETGETETARAPRTWEILREDIERSN
jgi:DNA-binding NtrC family response regulator